MRIKTKEQHYNPEAKVMYFSFIERSWNIFLTNQNILKNIYSS